MSKNFVDLIIKKRERKELTKEDIDYFINCTVNKSVPEYQISAMLMAIYFNSLTEKETAYLTLAMAHSGDTLDLSEIKGIKTDKHSTGGVADTTTLILAPLTASCGLPVFKMSGKGLGHTGGTIDKLESIPGFNTEISNLHALELIKKNNIVIMGQTTDLAPADKILYALRDVTGTIESIPLIASSIMSKKIAGGCDAFVLDVKCGNGAFMKTPEDAEKLAETMVKIGKNINKKVTAVITDMNEPLGMNIGNSFEVIEAIEILKGNIVGKLKEVSLVLGSHMLVSGEICETIDEAKKLLEENIKNKKGLAKLKDMIASQGGNPEVINNYSLFPRSKAKKEIKALAEGYIYKTDTYLIGKAAAETGAGRKTKTDRIDYGSGIILKHRVGDKISKNETIAEIYAETDEKCSEAEKILLNSIEIKETAPNKTNPIIKIIGG